MGQKSDQQGGRMIIPLLMSARPSQWTKNLLVFAGIIFSGEFTNLALIQKSLLLFVSFCLLSSAGYIANDIKDKEADAKHPRKSKRPIASGQVAPNTAMLFSLALAITAFAIAMLTNSMAIYCLGVYAINQLIYSFVARNIPIVDVFFIAFGFVIRAVAGAVVIQVYMSQWLLLCTLMLALFLGFSKRRNELIIAAESRNSLSGYTLQLLDQLIGITAASATIAYCIYAIQSTNAIEHPLLAATIPFPLFGVLKYLHIVYVKNDSGSPETVLLKDPWIWGTVLIWSIVSLIAMSNPNWRPF